MKDDPPIKPERHAVLLREVIRSVRGQVFMHNHRVSIYRPIIDAFVRHGFDRVEMKGRCKDEDPAFDDALGRGPQDIIRGRIR